MIDVKEAVQSAFNYIGKLYNADELVDLTLEEVELTDDERYWYITLGFTRELSIAIETPMKSPFDMIPTPINTMRVYKIFKVDAETGKTLSMKNRNL